MIIADCDDQGRFLAIPDSVKWTFCPNVEAIEIDEIGNLLGELAADRMIVVYGEAGQYGQIVNWWDYQKPRWARPSLYPPPDGWTDRVNIRQGDSVVSENWNEKGGFSDSDSYSDSDSDSDSTSPPTVGGHSTSDNDRKNYKAEWQSILLELNALADPVAVRNYFTSVTGIKEVDQARVVIGVKPGDVMMVKRLWKKRLGEAIGAACPQWAEREVIVEEV